MTERTRILTVATSAATAALAGLAAMPALAHHPMGGMTPETFAHGFLSGIGHPLIGLDHSAFVVAVGLVCAFLASRYLLPAVFVGGTMLGCLAMYAFGLALPAGELMIAASVLVIGAAAVWGRQLDRNLLVGFFALAGLFHGNAYAEAIVGAEATPLVAYLLGFGLVQYTVAIGAMWLVLGVWKASSSLALQPRIAGAVIAGVGATFLIENVEGMLFAGI